MQNCRPPSFFCTNTTTLYQTLWLGLIAPDSNISHRWFQTSSTNGGEIHLNHSLKGVSSITFIVEWVQANSTGSNENTLWYSAKSWQSASARSGAQESRPLKSNSSNNLPCLCLMVSLGVWESWDSSAPSSNCASSGGLGTGDAAVLFLTTTTAFLLPCLNLVYVFCTVRPCSKEPSSVHKACTMMLMHSPMWALPAFTGMMWEEKGSMISAFWVYINWS